MKTHIDLIPGRDKIRVIVELPGVNRDDIEIQVSENDVTVTAIQDGTIYHRRMTLPARKSQTRGPHLQPGRTEFTVTKRIEM